MNRLVCLVCIAAVAVVAAPRAGAEDSRAQSAQAEHQLEDAQRRLEQAAREVAELSARVYGQAIEEVHRIRIGRANRAILGINIGPAGPGTSGVRVVGVSPGGPAAEAGVKAEDLIVAVNGQEVGSGRDLVGLMERVKPGQKVDLRVLRNGERKDIAVTARAREKLFFMAGPADGARGAAGLPPLPHFLVGPFGDAELVSMTPGLGRYFGTDKGLLVVQAPKAVGTDLQDGDVILEIGGRVPQSPGHALRILGAYQPGETVDLKVLREHKERTVRLTIPASVSPAAPPAPPALPAPPAPPTPPAG